MNLIKNLWSRVQEPRVITALQCLLYLIAGVVGAIAVWAPPTTIETMFGLHLAEFWGAVLMIGGGVGAFAVLPGTWWVERIGLVLCISATLMYLVVIARLEVVGPGSLVANLGLTLIAVVSLAQRLVTIHRYPYDPERR